MEITVEEIKILHLFQKIVLGENRMSAIFLDIEGCLLESFDNPVITSFSDPIFKFAETQENIFIFSWAIWNNTDKFKFVNSPTFEFLCSKLNKQIPIDNVITKESLVPSFNKKIKTLDLNDFHDICNSKEIAFELFCRFDERVSSFNKFLLIDDTVENKIIDIGEKKIVFLQANETLNK